jgi:predicted nucleotidyltransferase
LPEQLTERLRIAIAGWDEAASLAFLFGSVARRQATSGSDLDILIVRRRDCDPDSETWRSQLVHLQQVATALSGNDTRVLEIGEDELGGGRIDPVLDEVVREGIELHGSRRRLGQLVGSRRARR